MASGAGAPKLNAFHYLGATVRRYRQAHANGRALRHEQATETSLGLQPSSTAVRCDPRRSLRPAGCGVWSLHPNSDTKTTHNHFVANNSCERAADDNAPDSPSRPQDKGPTRWLPHSVTVVSNGFVLHGCRDRRHDHWHERLLHHLSKRCLVAASDRGTGEYFRI